MLINKDEITVISELAALYENYGYKRYKLGCFEEYSLYQENKDFLLSKNVITFSDLNGRLMAMRPDVTLSIVRHNDVEKGCVDKFFYNEKVYRQAAGSKTYAEINQTGVEIIGDIDLASTAELVLLICKTLELISANFVVDLSHMGFTEGLLLEFGDDKEILADYLKRKDLHDFKTLAAKRKYGKEQIIAFEAAVSTCGTAEEMIALAESVCLNTKMRRAVEELKDLLKILTSFGYTDKLSINFSSTCNADYYNGVTFNGYIQNIPHCVLSGGRYDKLLTKLKKEFGAIGFALYLGELERYFVKYGKKVDILILYSDKTQLKALELLKKYTGSGKTVRLSVNIPVGLAYDEIIDIRRKDA